VVLLDKRQRPLVVNRKGRELFGLRKEVSLGREGLQSNASALTRALQRMVGEAIQPDSLARETLWLRVERPGSTPLLLRVVPVSDADECLSAWPNAAVAVFVDTVDRAQLSPEQLRSWFGFSAREAELATLLASGKDLASSAKAMRIGFETARTHLDRLFTKTGTSRQAELVSVLLRTAWRL
jgi:DNA-binding CsgD family transcriptional regulator